MSEKLMFKVSPYSDDRIEEYTVIKQTAQTIWYRYKDWSGKETGSITQERISGNWYDSREAAVAALIERAEMKVQHATSSLDRVKSRLAKLREKYGK